MDRKKVEENLSKWSAEFGFTFRGGSAPPNFFVTFTATPHRLRICQEILNTVTSRQNVEEIRKQLYLSKLKSNQMNNNSKDYMLKALHYATNRKLELWQKKESLEKKIAEERLQITETVSIFDEKASVVLSDVCKLAGIEKQCKDHKEKILLLKLLYRQHKREFEKWQNIRKILKDGVSDSDFKLALHNNRKEKFKKLVEELCQSDESTCNCSGTEACAIAAPISEFVQEHHSSSEIWADLVSCKKEAGETFCNQLTDVCDFEDIKLYEEKAKLTPNKVSVEQLMMNITEQSLQVMLHKADDELLETMQSVYLQEVENVKKSLFSGDEGFSEISFFDTIESNRDYRFLSENARNSLQYRGLKARHDYLLGELPRIKEECEKKEAYCLEKSKADEKVQEATTDLETLINEICSSKSKLKVCSRNIFSNHNELKSLLEEINQRLKDRKYKENLENSSTKLKLSLKNYLDLIVKAPMDSFRKRQSSLGKEIFECESLEHCFDHYGCEFEEQFSRLLVSPFQKVEAIFSELEERRNFLNVVKRAIAEDDEALEVQKNFLSKRNDKSIDLPAAEKNYREIDTTLQRLISRVGNMPDQIDFVHKVLKYWKEQPYRNMIPNSKTVDGLTLRQYEEQYAIASKELQYYSSRCKIKKEPKY